MDVDLPIVSQLNQDYGLGALPDLTGLVKK
jgi:hypothetical protein